MRVLELYAGIGGCAVALGDRAEIVAALDVDRDALAVYRHNLPDRTSVKNLEAVTSRVLAAFEAELWWLSPPCQPFTVKGAGGDHEDRRSRSLLRLIERIREVQPERLALENVPGFVGSVTHRRLREVLDGLGYEVRERLLCPSQLGWPNRRRRFYLLAARPGLLPPERALAPVPRRRLSDFLDSDPDPAHRVEPTHLERFHSAFHRVEAVDPAAVTSCFASSYGRQLLRSGSYLIEPGGGWRRFSPSEILRLLGFPATYRLPSELPLHRAYDLVGNSLSIPAVRWVLGMDGMEWVGPGRLDPLRPQGRR